MVRRHVGAADQMHDGTAGLQGVEQAGRFWIPAVRLACRDATIHHQRMPRDEAGPVRTEIERRLRNVRSASATRDRLTSDVYLPTDVEEPVGALEAARNVSKVIARNTRLER